MKMRRAMPMRLPVRLPLLLCALLLCAPLVLSVWLVGLRIAGIQGPVHTFLQTLQTPIFWGVPPAGPTPQWSAAALANGAWQKEFDAWWSSRLPLRGALVRSTNQVYYTWLNHSLMLDGKIAFGRDHHLFRLELIEAYCDWTHLRDDPARLEQWARNLKEVQDHFTRRGKTFIYILAPTKPGAALDFLPAGTTCPGPVDMRRNMALAAYARAGLRHIDAPAVLQQALQHTPADLLFPAGGFHWTELGASLVLREALLHAVPGQAGVPPPSLPPFTYRRVHAPYMTDNELVNVLHLWRYNAPAYLSPLVTFEPVTPVARPQRLALVGDSFLNYPADLLARTGLFSQIDHFYYFASEHRQYVEGRATMLPGSGKPPATYQALDDADMVIVEENQLSIGSPYIDELRNHLGLTRPAR